MPFTLAINVANAVFRPELYWKDRKVAVLESKERMFVAC